MYPATASEQMYAERAGFCSLIFLLNVLNPFFTSYTPCITMYYLLDRPANRLPAGSRLRKNQHFHAFPDFCSNQLLHRLQEFHRIPCRGPDGFRGSDVPAFQGFTSVFSCCGFRIGLSSTGIQCLISFELSWFGCSSTQAPEIWFPCFIIEHTACCSDYSDIPFHSILKVW